MNQGLKSSIFEIIHSAIVVGLGALVVLGFVVLLKSIVQPEETITPVDDRPPIVEDIKPTPATSTPSQPAEVNRIETLTIISPDQPYEVNESPYAYSQIYQEKSAQLALIGDFASAVLVIKGELPDDKKHFLSINIGTESGIYNAVRLSANTLNAALTKGNLGIFSKDHPIDLAIDLKADQTFAPTGEEFLRSGQSTKLVRLWDYIKPSPPAPSINRILVVPFNEHGTYTGTITSLEFRYTCVEGSSCQAALCPKDSAPGSKCILDEFGEDAFEQYKKYFE